VHHFDSVQPLETSIQQLDIIQKVVVT